MNSTSRTRRQGALKRPPLSVTLDAPEPVDTYIVPERSSKPAKRASTEPAERVPANQASTEVEMSPMRPLLWLLVPLVLVVIYGAISTWLKP